jgi:UPF0176 protein
MSANYRNTAIAKAQAITVTALYKFVVLTGLAALREELLAVCENHGIKGTLLLAAEGINGTVAGAPEAVSALHAFLKSDPRFADLDHKESHADKNPFARLKVRLKKEIVALGVPGIDAARDAGQTVAPSEWNELIADPATVLIDTRNDYEVAIGTFTGAIDPGTATFRDFPAWFHANRERFGNAPRFAMFCTGGIRCEKATAFVKAQGYREVFHLKGGILKYLEETPAERSRWQGECFVFDERVSVGHGLKPGPFQLCHACRTPLAAQDKLSTDFIAGVSCSHCRGKTGKTKLAALIERKRQGELARARGERHVAADLAAAKARKRARRGKT